MCAFIDAKISPALGTGNAQLYLEHLKVVLKQLDTAKLGQLRDASWPL